MNSAEAPPPFTAVILAAGEGTRMRSQKPKVLHEVAGRSMLAHVLAAATAAGASTLAVVVGPGRDDVAAEVARTAPDARSFEQSERRGTAHAVLAAREVLERGGDVLVLFADTPLVRPETIAELRGCLTDGAAVAVLGFEAADPTGYGRLLLDAEGQLAAVREERDATPAERAVRLCNAGLMGLGGADALSILGAIDDRNSKGEFYLTDVVGLARKRGLRTAIVRASEQEVLGVNDRVQLAAAEAALQARLRAAAMKAGVTMIDPETTFLSWDTAVASDVVIEPHVVIGPSVTIGARAVIHAFSHLAGAEIGEDVSVGPFARLRPGTKLDRRSRIGNFVETKAAHLGEGAKVNHLSYIGDAIVGASANIGAGTITCNYDGFSKHKTRIGAGAFVGSNSSLVAPVTIGDRAYVGSGSVITDEVPADALAVARGRQTVKNGWAADFRDAQQSREKT